jgi:hypothetical protein
MGGKTKIKMPCKLKALELHAKLSGEFTDRAVLTEDAVIRVVIGG